MTDPDDVGVPRFNGRTAVELASDAEDAVLGIVHLAEAHDVPLDVETVYRTLSGLTRVVEQLPEAVTRLRAVAIRQHEVEAFDVTTGAFAGNPAAAVGALHDAVDAMLESFGAVRTGLDNAQASLAGVETPTRAT